MENYEELVRLEIDILPLLEYLISLYVQTQNVGFKRRCKNFKSSKLALMSNLYSPCMCTAAPLILVAKEDVL